jgi:uncharacterized protein (TIGR02597 family)
LEGGTLAPLVPGDKVAIIPYWTFGTMFPGGMGIHAASSIARLNTEIYFPETTKDGINITPERTFYFRSGNWREVGAGSILRDDETIPPDLFIWIRHRLDQSTELISYGSVLPGRFNIPLKRLTTARQDSYVALPRPVALTLDELGLLQSGAYRASNRVVPIDEVHLYDPLTQGYATFYNRNNQWRKVGDNINYNGVKVVPPSTGILLRLGSAETSVLWSNDPTY